MRLRETRRELEAVIRQWEEDYKRKVSECDTERQRMRKLISAEVTSRLHKDFESQLKALKMNAATERTQIVEDYEAKVRSLQRQLHHVQRSPVATDDNQSQDEDVNMNVAQPEVVKLKEQWSQLRAAKRELEKKLATVDATRSNNSSLKKNENIFKSNASLTAALQADLEAETEKVSRLLTELEKQRIEKEELLFDMTSLRECSDKHIRALELELDSLQTKAVAMENLNGYLQDDVTIIQNDEKYSHDVVHSHDVSRDSLRSLPVDVQRHLLSHSMTSDCDNTYAEILSPNTSLSGRSRRPEKISYVKKNEFAAKSSTSTVNCIKTPSLLGRLRGKMKHHKDESSVTSVKSNTSFERGSSFKVNQRSQFQRNDPLRHTIQTAHGRARVAEARTAQDSVVRTTNQGAQGGFVRHSATRRTMPTRAEAQKRETLCKFHQESSKLCSYHECQQQHLNPYHAKCAHGHVNTHTPRCKEGQVVFAPHKGFPDSHTNTPVSNDEKDANSDQGQSTCVSNDSLAVQVVKQCQVYELNDSHDQVKSESDAEQRVFALETENRKLKTIIETLYRSMSGKNPLDKTEYHYFTTV